MDSREELLRTLRLRFEENMFRHEKVSWKDVEPRIADKPAALASLWEMEKSGGEPDVTGRDPDTGGYLFMDCSTESPSGRRSLCYDQAALAGRKKNKPEGSVLGMAEAMGIDLLTEAEYRALQKLETFDRKTSSWVKTPPEIRESGGALFCDYRYGRVFLYHNGADSYYASRGFRAVLRVY